MRSSGFSPIEVDASFSDIMENFDIGFMGVAELRYDRYALLTDVMYTKLSADAATPFGILADSVDVTSETF